MQIENIGRWVWMLVGTLLGVLIGYQWSSVSDNIDGVVRASQVRFEQELTLKDKDGGPLIKGIVVHPAIFSPTDDSYVNVVTYQRLAQDKEGKKWWIEKCFIAKIPFEPMNGAVAATPDLTIDKYLTEIAGQASGLKYNFGWWMMPKYAMMLGAFGGFVLIGGLWPSLINIMVGAGLGGKREPKQKDDKPLWAYKGKDAPVKAKPTVSAEQQQELADITAAYQQNVGDASPVGAPAAADTAAAPPPEVRKLESTTLAAAEAPRKEEDDLEIKGEYYPVLIHHQKKKEDDHPKGPGAGGH